MSVGKLREGDRNTGAWLWGDANISDWLIVAVVDNRVCCGKHAKQ